MKILTNTLAAAALLITAGVQAEPVKDCMLEGTVHKSEQDGQEHVNVEFHSMKRYSADSRCRVKGDKMEFRLPADPRLEDAPAGSTVKYRYQENRDGESQTDLVSIGA